jgi:hypothetical protein
MGRAVCSFPIGDIFDRTDKAPDDEAAKQHADFCGVASRPAREA